MKFPCLIPRRMCKTQIKVILYGEGLSETGSPIIILEKDFKCNYQDKAKTMITKDKKEVEIIGSALFPGDIAPELPIISAGQVVIFGEKRDIAVGTKARNPDGTVNYCRLELA